MTNTGGTNRSGFGDAATASDPYPFYARLRSDDPVHWSEEAQAWFVTRYEDVYELLMDQRLGARTASGSLEGLPPSARTDARRVEQFLSRWLVFADPPYQAKARRMVAGAFSPSAVAELEGSLQEHAKAVVGRFADGGDLIAELSRPYALAVIGDVLGAVPEELADLSALARVVMDYLGSRVDAEIAERASAAIRALTSYVGDVVLPRAKGAVAGNLARSVRDGSLTVEEAAGVFTQLLTGGIEPVSVATAVCLVAVHGQPETLRQVRSGALSWESAIEEALRYDPPFHFAPRRAREDFEFRGRHIRAGQRVALVLASANRDENRFAAPERFDATRGAHGHLAFGRGGHFCVGAVLARTGIRVLLRCLDERLPTFRPRVPATRLPALGATVLDAVPAYV
ncbi:cytochrome P450 [Micromonospora parva]|uniref:cytochrome P450 n=1 Tax=Micromonospora parva TaxID=1464048 RepID=UPI0033F452CA